MDYDTIKEALGSEYAIDTLIKAALEDAKKLQVSPVNTLPERIADAIGKAYQAGRARQNRDIAARLGGIQIKLNYALIQVIEQEKTLVQNELCR